MVYVIGDIHGEVSKLKKLINRIIEVDNHPTFVFIGDYLDKGENPRETLEFLVKLKKIHHCKFLWGNHEYIWMGLKENNFDNVNYLKKYGGLQTLKSFDTTDFSETLHLMMSTFKESFFNHLIPYFKYKNFVITHSGIPPGLFQSSLDSIPVKSFLFNRYDFIEYESFFQENYKVIFGHTGFYTPYHDGYKIGIDTAACFLEDQPLTAFNVDEEYFINSDHLVSSLKEIDTNICPNIIRSKPWRIIYD